MNLRKAIDVVDDYQANMTVAEVYDEDEQFRTAMSVLFPDFEYPDFSHLTMKQVLSKAGVF